jgi:N-acetylmuramoyl-L-alanine amidase
VERRSIHLRHLRAVLGAALLLSLLAGGLPAGELPLSMRPRAPGALTGKTVFLSPGHGFYHHPSLGWITQRGNTHDIVEDFLNAELACQHLAAYLENSGADVWTCRERSFATVEVIVDDGDPEHTETGEWAPTSSGGWDGDGRYAEAATAETATASYTPAIPESGVYPLYVRFNAGSNRSDAVRVRVENAAGAHEAVITQRRDGFTWRYAGTFFWPRGSGQRVVISNRSTAANTGRVVIADAIRVGGGIGSEPPNGGGPPSGRRRADECSVYWARYQGAPAAVYDPSSSDDGTDDVTCRPLYAEFESETGEDSVYVSVHSNAGGGRGTETYMYTDGTPAGSAELRDRVHAEIIADLRAEWDAAWTDRGVKAANFGELRLLETMPGILVETAFHDSPEDAAAEREPRWRRLVARAIYHGVARHFGGDGVTLLPEPPERVRAVVSGAACVISWQAPRSGAAAGGAGAASGYRVYRSPDGFAFDSGEAVAGTSLAVSGLARGSLTCFRVTAVNSGGESFPSQVLAVRVPLANASPRVLVVGGYDRLDAAMNRREDTSGALGTVDRQILDRHANSFDYTVEHALALARLSLDLALDSADNEAVASGDVDLGEYDLVDWYVGREGVADDTLNSAEREALRRYLEAGGRLLVSGADLGTDLEASSSSAAREFFNTWLKASYIAGDAESHTVRAAEGGAFSAQEEFRLHDGTAALYDADSPDVYAALGGARLALAYGTEGSAGAAVQFAGGYRLIHLGFPLEAVLLPGARDLLAALAADFLLEPVNAPPQAVVLTAPPSGEVRLEGGSAVVTLDGSLSTDGEGGAQGLHYRWMKVGGPAGDAIESAEGWERGPAGFGYGDGDDATVLDDMEGAYASVFLVHAFEAPSAAGIERLELRVAYDDGVALYLNGVEVARRNLAAGAAWEALADGAGEPVEETIDLFPFRGVLRTGRNVLAAEVHNASLGSSDLSFAAELAAGTAARREPWVPPGALWFFHRGRTPPPSGWSGRAFEPTPRSTRVALSLPGTYRYRLEVDDGQPRDASDATEVEIRVRAEEAEEFRRADSDASGEVDITDAIFTLHWLFTGGDRPSCLDAVDANDSGAVDLSDPVAALNWLFLGAAPPLGPGPFACGEDPTPDPLAPCPLGACE